MQKFNGFPFQIPFPIPDLLSKMFEVYPLVQEAQWTLCKKIDERIWNEKVSQAAECNGASSVTVTS